jgi:hypothetical protein
MNSRRDFASAAALLNNSSVLTLSSKWARPQLELVDQIRTPALLETDSFRIRIS